MEHYQQELATVDKNLQATLQNGSHLNQLTGFSSRETELNDHLDKFNRDIVSTKETKYFSDKKAFSLNKAYKWSQSHNRRYGRSFHKNTQSNV